MEHQSQVLGGRRHVLDDVPVERRQPDAIALRAGEPRERRREPARIVEFAHAPRALGGAPIAHRGRHVEQHDEIRVRLRLELLYIETVAAREEPPVDSADVVARHVRPVFREIRGRPEMRRAMQPVHESLDHRACQQLEIADPREDGGIEQRRLRRCRCRRHIPDRGRGTASSSLSIT